MVNALSLNLNKANHFRERAEELRAIAETYWTAGAAKRLVRIADDYEKMAANFEARRRSPDAR